LLTLILLIPLLFAPQFVNAWSDGPPDGHAGDPPAMNTCVLCHDSFDLDSGIGGIILGFPFTSYEPSTPYTVPVVMGHTGLEHWGFQMTVLDAANHSAGFFIPASGNYDHTLVSENSYPQPDYVGQSAAGVMPGNPFGMWNIRWISPPVGTGTVTAFSTGMGADGDGSTVNDYVCSFELELTEIPGGEEGPIAYMEDNFHDFGNVPIGTSRTWTERLFGIGSEPIGIDEWNWLDDGPFSVVSPQLPLILGVGEQVDLTIEFEPLLTGNWQDSLDFGIANMLGTSGLTVRGQGTFALPPEPFHLISPVDGEFVSEDSVRFVWQSTTNPDSIDPIVIFDLEVDTESDFPSSVFYEVGPDTSIALPASEFADDELYFWRVYARDTNTPGTYSEEVWAFVTDFSGVYVNGSPAVADDPFMVHIWPNPFNEQVSITFALPHPTRVEAEVLDLLGRRVAVLHSGPMGAGSHVVHWSGTHPSGVYLVRITLADSSPVHRKIVRLKWVRSG